MRYMYKGSEFHPAVFPDTDRTVRVVFPTPGILVKSGNLSPSEQVHATLDRGDAAALIRAMRNSPTGCRRIPRVYG